MPLFSTISFATRGRVIPNNIAKTLALASIGWILVGGTPTPPTPPAPTIQTGGSFIGYTQKQLKYEDGFVINDNDLKTRIAKDDKEIELFIKTFTEWLV